MPLNLKLKTKTTIPLEVDQVRLETIRNQSTDEINRTEIYLGNEKCQLGDYFTVSGSASDDNELIWEGDCEKVKLIGSKLTEGTVRVLGNAGMHLGAEMLGGEIIVDGNASDWVGAEMKGGRITVRGNSGHLVGAVYRGGHIGMTGGEIYIHGNAGNEIGHAMRRGMIVIGGESGDAAGFHMIAGSIFLFGKPGIRPGAGMKRGTICLFDTENAPELLPSFKYALTYQPDFLKYFLLELKKNDFPFDESCLSSSYARHNGDFLETGKGEILIRTAV